MGYRFVYASLSPPPDLRRIRVTLLKHTQEQIKLVFGARSN